MSIHPDTTDGSFTLMERSECVGTQMETVLPVTPPAAPVDLKNNLSTDFSGN